MVHQVITIERKKYAVGLFWQPVAADQNARNYAQELSRKIGGRLNYFVEYRYLVGLGSYKSGHRSGMSVAAAELMEDFAEFSSFLAAFKVAEGVWIVAVRNGVILNDILFATEDEAKKYYARLAELPDWGALVAPGAWAISRATEKQLEGILGGNKNINLRPISRFRLNFLIFLILLLIASFTFYLSKDYLSQTLKHKQESFQIDQKVADEYKKLMQEKSKLSEPQPQQIQPQEQMPDVSYYEISDKIDRMNICWKAIGFLMQSIPGWVQTYAECGSDYAVADVKRTSGTLDDFYAYGETIMAGVGVQEKSDSEVMLSVKLPEPKAIQTTPQMAPEDVARIVNTAFQLINSDAIVTIGSDSVQDGNNITIINFVDVKADSKLIPLEFIKIFEDFDGMDILLVRWDAKKMQWNYEVRIYAK